MLRAQARGEQQFARTDDRFRLKRCLVRSSSKPPRESLAVLVCPRVEERKGRMLSLRHSLLATFVTLPP